VQNINPAGNLIVRVVSIMKAIEQNPTKLVMRDNDLFLKLWGIVMPIFCTVALVFILPDYSPKLKPAVIICIIFILMGLFALFFMQEKLTYVFDKVENRADIFYPVKFATGLEKVSFPMDQLESLSKKMAIMSRGGDKPNSTTRPYVASGFDFVLKSGERIHCGLYSSDYKEITNIIDKVAGFINVPVVESKEEADILFN
jgi:hypothetical protein